MKICAGSVIIELPLTPVSPTVCYSVVVQAKMITCGEDMIIRPQEGLLLKGAPDIFGEEWREPVSSKLECHLCRLRVVTGSSTNRLDART